MAEDVGQSKTEDPTQRRREEAREQGQVARSRELTSSLVLVAGLGALALGAGTLGSGMLERVQHDFNMSGQVLNLGPDEAQRLLADAVWGVLALLGTLLGTVFVMAVAANVLQVGLQINPGLLGLNWERISPVSGWSRIFSWNSGVHGLVSVLKIVAMVIVVYVVLRQRMHLITGFHEATLAAVVALAWKTVLRLALAIAGMLALLGVADYAWQWWRLEQSLRMSRQEIKEEMKRDEGDPTFKARIRKLQRQAALKRMLQDVPRSTVVLTNPTHLAVALRYERGTSAAPLVIAKGAGVMADRIKEIARRHGVPILERKPIAQALYKSVKIGQEIPEALFHVIAEILAYVYGLRAT